MDSPSLNQALATHQSLSPITASLALPHLPLALALGTVAKAGDGEPHNRRRIGLIIELKF